MKRFRNAEEIVPYLPDIASDKPHVYIVHEREFINSQQPVYKIGRTDTPFHRFYGYPKNSLLLYIRDVYNSKTIEKQIKTCFKLTFQQMRDFGVEYFMGNIEHMVTLINKIIIQSQLLPSFIWTKPSLTLYFRSRTIMKPLPKPPIKTMFKVGTPKLFKSLPPLPLTIEHGKTTFEHKCHKCDLLLSSKRKLESHLVKKNPCDRQCSKCDYKGLNARQLKKHMLKHFPRVTKNVCSSYQNVYECHKCHMFLTTSQNLQTHLSRKNPCDRQCYICDYKGSNARQLKKHMKKAHEKTY